MRLPFFLFLVGLFILGSCKKPSVPEDNFEPNGTWLIPTTSIQNFGTARDPIQSIDQPYFVSVGQSRLADEEEVYALRIHDKVKIYPLSVLATHEVVNDSMDNIYLAFTYCPITASALVWNRKILGKVTTFGVSGMLFHDNLMPYDRNTGSIWSQMRLQCIHGDYISEIPEVFGVLKTKFGSLKKAYPEARVLTDTLLLAGKSGKLKTTAGATHYFGVVGTLGQLLFRDNLFGDSLRVIETRVRSTDLVVVGSRRWSFIIAFRKPATGFGSSFSAWQNAYPQVMIDDLGNRYDVFGKVVSGPSIGKQLQPVVSFSAKDWAWEAFYPDAVFYEK
jgi:hypothetical protein